MQGNFNSPLRNQTGKSLKEWGDKYNLTREAVRRLRNKWGTITDELMLKRVSYKKNNPKKVDN